MKAVIFDFDGTLVNSEHLYLNVLSRTLKSYGVIGSPSVFEKLRSQHPDRLFDQLLGETKGQQALLDFKTSGKQIYGDIEFFDGIEALLYRIKEHGLKVGVWTARDLESAVGIIDTLGMGEFFDVVVSGSCVENNKPSSDGIQKVAATLSLEFSEMLMVGDHDHDIQAANAVGCSSVFAQWKPEKNELSPEITATQIQKSVAGLEHWLGAQLGWTQQASQ